MSLFPADTRNSKFYIPFILSENKHFAIKKCPNYKNTQRLQGVAIKVVPENLSWCWKVKKMVLKQDVENSAQNISFQI